MGWYKDADGTVEVLSCCAGGECKGCRAARRNCQSPMPRDMACAHTHTHTSVSAWCDRARMWRPRLEAHTPQFAAARVCWVKTVARETRGGLCALWFVHFKLCICGAAHRADQRKQRARTMATLSSYKFCGTKHSRRCSNFGAETSLCVHNTL